MQCNKPVRIYSAMGSSSPRPTAHKTVATIAATECRPSFSRAKSIKISAKQFVTHKIDQKLEDEYEVGDLLGEGGYGEVYSCRHRLTGAARAVKVVIKENGSYNHAVRNEHIILKKLDHPNCLKQYHLFEDPQYFFVITDIYTGGELFDVLLQGDGRMTERDTAGLMNHVLSCVNYFHSQGIIHRDLKPENILLSGNLKWEDCKIIDFGLSICYDDKTDGPLTEIVGTSYYASPQVLNGKPYTTKSDVWSCGVITFLLLAGFAPFDGDTVDDVVCSVVEGVYDFNDPMWRTISDTAKDFIMYLLSYEENTRPTALEALQHPWLRQSRLFSSLSFKTTRRKSHNAMTALQNMEKFDAHSKLKQAAYALLSSQLVSPAEKDEIDHVFRYFDSDCSGQLSKSELQQAFREFYGKTLSDTEVDILFRKVNFSGSGAIEYSEFVVACLMETSILDEKKLHAVFAEFDLDGSGSISVDELKQILYAGCIDEDRVDHTMIESIMRAVDKDGDNEIDFEEFRLMMLRANVTNSETSHEWSPGTPAGYDTSYPRPLSIPLSLASSTSGNSSLSSCFEPSLEGGSEADQICQNFSKSGRTNELDGLAILLRGNASNRRSIFERQIELNKKC